jgi:hypothetical protein
MNEATPKMKPRTTTFSLYEAQSGERGEQGAQSGEQGAQGGEQGLRRHSPPM